MAGSKGHFGSETGSRRQKKEHIPPDVFVSLLCVWPTVKVTHVRVSLLQSTVHIGDREWKYVIQHNKEGRQRQRQEGHTSFLVKKTREKRRRKTHNKDIKRRGGRVQAKTADNEDMMLSWQHQIKLIFPPRKECKWCSHHLSAIIRFGGFFDNDVWMHEHQGVSWRYVIRTIKCNEWVCERWAAV